MDYSNETDCPIGGAATGVPTAGEADARAPFNAKTKTQATTGGGAGAADASDQPGTRAPFNAKTKTQACKKKEHIHYNWPKN